MRVPFEELPETCIVFRLVNLDDRYWPAGQDFPDGTMAFRPSSADEKEGAARGHATLVSVFDHDLTTVDEGTAFRFGKPCRPVWMTAGEVRLVEPGRLTVRADPLPPERGPGGDGHCGIEGLAPLDGETGKRAPKKEQYKRMLDRLAQRCQTSPPRASARER